MTRAMHRWKPVWMLVVAAGVGALAAWALPFLAAREAATPPASNVVLLVMDTTRRDHLTFYGYERDTSPHLQRMLANRGVVFDQAVAVNSNTAPAHGSMFTGLYPTTHGILRNGMSLREDVRTLAETLRDDGYATGGFVSGWTLTRHTGLQRGFDTYDDHIPGKGWRQQRTSDETLSRALPWVREQVAQSKPFFLFFHAFDPHHPYDPPPELGRRFLPEGQDDFTTENDPALPHLQSEMGIPFEQRLEYVSRYDGEIAFADQQMGELLAELSRLGQDRHTIVVFLSDHGETLLEREFAFSHGGQAYDEQIWIPLAFRLPRDAGGRRVSAPASQVDLYPTLLDLLGKPVPEGLAGRSLAPLLRGERVPEERRPLFSNARPEPGFVPEVRAPLVRRGLVGSVRLPEVKLIEYPAPGDTWYQQLFDLRNDPGETKNLADAQPELVEQLHGLLDDWRHRTGGEVREAPPELSPEVHRALKALGYVE